MPEAHLEPAPGTGQDFYVRQATGLVREIGLSSNVVINISAMSIPLALLVATEGTYAFPGANLPLVIVLTVILCILPTLMYGWLGTTMPRSGGDYVFVSRILKPILGFAANFNITTWYVLFMAQFASLIAPLGIGAALTTIGVSTHNQSLVNAAADVSTHNWEFGIGLATLILSAILMSLKVSTWTRIVVVVFALSIIGVIIAAILTGFSSRAGFQSDLARFGGNYNGMLAAAHKAGYPNIGFSLHNTFNATPLAFATFGYAFTSVYAAGEIRSPRRTMMRAFLLSLSISGLVVFVLFLLAERTFGGGFLGAATYLSNVAPKSYPLSTPPFYFLFVAMLTHSAILITIMGISFVLAFFVVFPITFLIASRNLFAWSFDRILPSKVAEVNDRTHSPVIANTIILVVAVAFMAFVVYGPSAFLTLVYTAGAAELLTFVVVAIAATVFPWRRRELYQGSPAAHNWFKVPAITVAGVLSIAIYVYFLVPLLTNDTLGANATPGIITMIIVALLPFAIYAISYLINRRRGVDLGISFRELPPE
jgi:APA family basic amino acid/polyamine antiporter